VNAFFCKKKTETNSIENPEADLYHYFGNRFGLMSCCKVAPEALEGFLWVVSATGVGETTTWWWRSR
jgi:hypothetical protein